MHPASGPTRHPHELGLGQEGRRVALGTDEVHVLAPVNAPGKLLQTLAIGTTAHKDQMQIVIEKLENVKRPDCIAVSFIRLKRSNAGDEARLGREPDGAAEVFVRCGERTGGRHGRGDA